MVLGFTQTCFEGSMYLFVFIWVPTLQEASETFPNIALPLGYIFSSFMVSMMLGSLLYTAIVSRGFSLSSGSSADSSLTLHAKLSSMVCAVSAVALAASIKSQSEHVRFWAFCLFEACVGMYYPVQGMLRGTLIANEHRATASNFSQHTHLHLTTLTTALITFPCAA
jgi:MFS transporter, MFS domain-containing protein family, molybdate-anion transporter